MGDFVSGEGRSDIREWGGGGFTLVMFGRLQSLVGRSPVQGEGVGTGAAAQPIDDTKTALLPRQALDVT